MKTETEIIEILNNSIILAKFDYLQHKKIFFESKDINISIINRTAPYFFNQLNKLLWDRMILSISKLTDKYYDKSNKNLSLEYIVEISSKNNMKSKTEIKELYNRCLLCVNGIRKYRSKVTAHRDLSEVFYSELKVHITEIEEAFQIMEKIMNLYHKEKSEMTWSFELYTSHDAGSLLYFLEQGLIYEYVIEKRKDYYLDFREEEEWKKTLA